MIKFIFYKYINILYMCDPIYKNKLPMMNDGRFSSTNTRVVPYSLCKNESVPMKRNKFWNESMIKANKESELYTQGNTSTICELEKSTHDYTNQQQQRYGGSKNNGMCKY
jgi:hypothetical protein